MVTRKAASRSSNGGDDESEPGVGRNLPRKEGGKLVQEQNQDEVLEANEGSDDKNDN